jgi:predicted glycoside hydrolase/deacetylase ChbG (UPF0249 family)
MIPALNERERISEALCEAGTWTDQTILVNGRLLRVVAPCAAAGDFAMKLHTLVANLPVGTTQLMTHPGRVDAALRSLDGYTWQREEELATLLSREFREVPQRSSIRLTRFESGMIKDSPDRST